MRTKCKIGEFDLIVYPHGFSLWHKGQWVIDASKVYQDREVEIRKGGDARLKIKVVKSDSPQQRHAARPKGDIAGSCGNVKCPDYQRGEPGNCGWRIGKWSECSDYKPATSA